MGISSLRQYIKNQGLTTSDCIERGDLLARAREAREAHMAAMATDAAMLAADPHDKALAALHEQLAAEAARAAAAEEAEALRGPGSAERWYRRHPNPPPSERDLLRQEQDREYEESLELDRAREESAAAEEAARREREAQAEERRAAAAAAALAAVDERRRRLVPEPPAGAEGAVAVLARLPDGSRLQRRFAPTDSVRSLYDWVHVARADQNGAAEASPAFRLVSNMPRRVHADDPGVTLEAAGLATRQCAVFVEPTEPDEE